jgi:outer membrane protein assembly factor BamB
MGLKWLHAVAALLLVLALPAGALGWSRRLTSAPGNMVSDGGNAIITTLERFPRPHESFAEIVKVSTESGRTAWHRRWRGRGRERSDQVYALAVTPNGDVVAGGTMLNGSERDDFVVMRLGAHTGRPMWQAVVRGRAPQAPYEQAADVALAPNGDVVAAGSIADIDAYGHYGNFAVVALHGTTGTERWRFVVEGAVTGMATQVAVDGAGDVIVAGTQEPDSTFDVPSITVMKLAGASGAVLWQQRPTHVLDVRHMVLDGRGDVLLAVTADARDGRGNALGVVKLSGVTGDTDWIARTSLTDDRWQVAVRVIADDVGGVFAAGMIDDGTGHSSHDEGMVFTVVHIDSATGALRWSYRVGGDGRTGFAEFLALGPGGTILAAGSASTPATCEDAFVVALDRASGEPRWSQTFDGSFATTDCHPQLLDHGLTPPVDNDAVTGLAVDRAGRIIVGGYLQNGTRRPRSVPFLRPLAVGR